VPPWRYHPVARRSMPVVTLNAIAAVSSAATSPPPPGSAKSLSADTVDGVLEKISEVMAQVRSDLADREKNITSALQHNREAVASGIRCKPTGALSGFVIRLGDGTDSFGLSAGRAVVTVCAHSWGGGFEQRAALGAATYAYEPSGRRITTSSAGHGGPSRRALRSSRPARCPFGNWSPGSERHAATMARTRTRHSLSSSSSASA
jgi:hypothetical protein